MQIPHIETGVIHGGRPPVVNSSGAARILMRMLRTTLAIVLALLLVVSDWLPATADEPKPAAEPAPVPTAEPAAPTAEELRSRLEAIAADE